MDKDQTLAQTPLMDIDQFKLKVSPTEARENLNLQRVRMSLLHFCL